MWIPREPEVFGQPTSPTRLEGLLADHRDVADLGPLDAGDGIQVHPQLVGMVQVVGADRVRVEVDAAEVVDPGQPRRVLDHDLVGGPAARERQFGRAQPLGRVVRGSLLEERLLGDAVDEPLERHRARADAGQRALGDGDW